MQFWKAHYAITEKLSPVNDRIATERFEHVNLLKTIESTASVCSMLLYIQHYSQAYS